MKSHSPQSALSTLPQAFRPARELYAALLWLLFAIGCLRQNTPTCDAPIVLSVLAGLALLWSLVRFLQGTLCLRRKARLAGFSPNLMTLAALKPRFTRARSKKAVYLGLGFEWTASETQSAYELQKTAIASLIPPRGLLRLLLTHRPLEKDAIGAGWIHGLTKHEVAINVPLKTLEGGTLILGTTQSGKGVLLTLLISQAIARGETVIVIDPKGSPRLLSAMDRACCEAKRAPAYRFHPGSRLGVRLDPLANYTRVTELASRVTAALHETGPFAAFAWRAVYVAANLLLCIGEAPSLVKIQNLFTEGAEAPLSRYAKARFGLSEFEILYEETHRNTAQTLRKLARNHDVTLPLGIEDALELFVENAEHQTKLTASLLPLLASLTAGELKDSLSGESDTRESVRLDTLIDTSGVLYVATDALPDAFSAASIATLLLSDLASVAGKRYNMRLQSSPVNLFIDEASNVMSTALIELLNKGAEAGIHTTCAMQTVSDLEARLSSAAAARMALGNFNTLIALRTKDLETARYATETFGMTAIGTLEASRSSSSATLAAAYAANFTRRLAVSREPRVSPELLGQLPNTEFFASIAGGRIVKGRVPILVGEQP